MDGDRHIELYKIYLAAFNARSLSGIKDCLAPTCTVEFQGKQVSKNREEMLPNYSAHWKTLSSPIDILEIKPIQGGVWTLLRVHDEDRDIEVEYYFNEEGLQIKHIIQGITPFEKTGSTSLGEPQMNLVAGPRKEGNKPRE
jgi:hypothetical protein